mmetsp:Transcript_58839/g.140316  ORF Transcript_58839/g.140316 Transcript_58839/m.140316 type:complete len:85 (+) Transcript_58839:162-416(+)
MRCKYKHRRGSKHAAHLREHAVVLSCLHCALLRKQEPSEGLYAAASEATRRWMVQMQASYAEAACDQLSLTFLWRLPAEPLQQM